MEHSVDEPKIVGAYGNYEVVTETLIFRFTQRQRAEVFLSNLQNHCKGVECVCED